MLKDLLLKQNKTKTENLLWNLRTRSLKSTATTLSVFWRSEFRYLIRESYELLTLNNNDNSISNGNKVYTSSQYHCSKILMSLQPPFPL